MLAFRLSGASPWLEWRPGSALPIALGGATPPPNAEALMSDAELAYRHLYRVIEDPIPEGRTAIDWSLEDDDGVPRRVPLLADPPTLEERRAARCAEVNARRDGLMYGGLAIDFGGEIGSKVMQTDAISRGNWQMIWTAAGFATMAGQGAAAFKPDLASEDNTNIPGTNAQVEAWMRALVAKGVALWEYAKALKRTIAASDDPESVDIEHGWPPSR